MKNSLRHFLILMSLLAAACSNNETDGSYPFSNDPTPDFSCIINDHPWVADSATYTLSGDTTILTAYLSGTSRIRISLNGFTAGIYPIVQGTNDFTYQPNATAFSTANLGDVVISSHNLSAGKITGTFDNISANGSAGWFNITDGYFINIKRKSPISN